MTRIAVQLYSLRHAGDPLSTLVERVADAGYAGVEFAGLEGTSPADVAAALERTGLAAAGAHVPAAELEADLRASLAAYRTVGTTDLVVPWLDPEAFASRAAVERTAARLEELATRVADAGGRLHYHTHDHEFRTLEDGTLAFDALAAATERVRLQPDLGWAGVAGVDPLAVLDAHADRIDTLHLKDYDAAAGDPVPLGAGDLPVREVLDAAADHDVSWVVYEAEHEPDGDESGGSTSESETDAILSRGRRLLGDGTD